MLSLNNFDSLFVSKAILHGPICYLYISPNSIADIATHSVGYLEL